MTTNAHTLKKRAVYTGLQLHLPDRDALDALLLWEQKYAGRATFPIRYFVEEVVADISQAASAKKLLTSLVAALNAPEAELLPDPQVFLDAHRSRASEPATDDYRMPELEAFKLLVSKWLELAGPDMAAEALDHVVRYIHRLRMPIGEEAQLRLWLKNRNSALLVRHVEVKHLRALINLMYVGFCETLGPVKADALLGTAVERLKNNGGAAYSVVFAKLL